MGAATSFLPSFLWPAASGVQSLRDPLNFKHYHQGLSSYRQMRLAEDSHSPWTDFQGPRHGQYSAPLG